MRTFSTIRPIGLLLGVGLLGLQGCDRSPTEPNDVIPSEPTPTVVGEVVSLNTQSREACEDPRYRTGRVEAVSQRAVILADTANPANGFTQSDYQWFADRFDEVIAPLAERNFGEWTDLDDTGRVVLFFTKEVNQLSRPEADAFVAGFFFARDLFPRTDQGRFQGCAHSNERELLYLMVPDPDGDFGRDFTRDQVFALMPATLIHELQHLINAARRLHIVPRGGEWAETVWLNEALSHTAEELLFYEVTGLGPGENLSRGDLDPWQRPLFDRYQQFNFRRLHEHIDAPSENAPYNPNDALSTRGAAWSFLRYLGDRFTEQPEALFGGLIDREARGLENLAAAFEDEATVFEGLGRWSVALYADGRVSGLDDLHTDRSWNHAANWQAIQDGPYGIETHPLGSEGTSEADILGGGSAYFRFAVPTGQRGAVELSGASGGEDTFTDDCDYTVSPAVGEGVEIDGSARLVVCVDAPAGLGLGQAEYVLVSTAATAAMESEDDLWSIFLAARGENVQAVSGPPSPLVAGVEGAPVVEETHAHLHRDAGFDRRLREIERRELTPLVRGGSSAGLAAQVEAPGRDALRHTLLRTR